MLEDLLASISPWSVAITATAIYGAVTVARWIIQERKIRKLGGHAPLMRTYLPFGLDFIYPLIKTSLNNGGMEFWQECFQKTSHTFEANVGGLRMVLTEDPENIRALLATQFKDFGKGEHFHRDWHEFLGDSIFTTDGDQWHRSRQLIRPQFIKDRVSDLDTFETHIGILLRKMGGDGREVDLKDLFFRYTLDAATDFLLGKSVGSLENPQSKFGEAFAEVQRVQSIISRLGPLNKFWPRRSYRKNLKIINEFVHPYIDRALLLSPEELEKKTSSHGGYTFLHALAASTRDRKDIRDQLVAVLIAGRDTTAATLSWTFYELARNPQIFNKLREEILTALGNDGRPTYDDLKSIKYLQFVINETLRLYPAVPFNVRGALQDTSLPRGGGPDGLSPIGMPKDTPVAYSPLTMQRREDLYPAPSPTSFTSFPPVAEFCPERWMIWTPKSWQYIPFNGGPRICVGQQFALTEMAYTIVRLMQTFDRIEARWGGGHGTDGADETMNGEFKMPLNADVVLQPGKEVTVALWRTQQEKR